MSATREDLIAICERAFVPQEHWHDRDSSAAQRQLGECYALLRAGCDFNVITAGDLASTADTWWVAIAWHGFQWFEYGSDEGFTEDDTFYLPTSDRLDRVAGMDWY